LLGVKASKFDGIIADTEKPKTLEILGKFEKLVVFENCPLLTINKKHPFDFEKENIYKQAIQTSREKLSK
jgi:hypothetical protein